jgi:tryptophanyl-tRNA synthetase
MGLYNYPILMAADILLYDTDVVPVGKDQKQHLEFARDIAGYFNNMYGDVFKLPVESIREDVGLIPGLDGRKMSKSYGNQIPIFDSAADLEKKIMKIATDSARPEDKKNPDDSVIFTIYREFATPEQIAVMRNKFLNGKIGYGDAKKELFAVMDKVLAPRREVFNELMANPDRIMGALEQGATRARPVAEATIARVRKAVGL